MNIKVAAFTVSEKPNNILMDFLIHIDTSKGQPIVYFNESQVEFSNYDVFLALKVILNKVNSADSDETRQIRRIYIPLPRVI